MSHAAAVGKEARPKRPAEVRAEEGARAAGKDPARLELAQLQSAFVWDDGDAWEQVREGARQHIGVYDAWDEGADTPGKGFWVSPPEDDKLKHLVPAGTPDEVTAALRPWVQAFGDREVFHLIVRLQFPGMDFEVASHAVELFAERVMPALRGA